MCACEVPIMDFFKTTKITTYSGHVFFILELVLLISQIGLSSTQRHLSGYTISYTWEDLSSQVIPIAEGVQDGQVNLLDRSRQDNLPNVLTPDSHVDLTGEHGNRSPHPVIHRHSGTGSHTSDIAHSHQHGNNLHSTSVNGMMHGPSAAHVDLPGQHGNESPFPAVHRQPVSDVDLPRRHGNESPFPAVHREPGSHVDLPGQHGKEFPFPAVHGHSSSHVDFPGQHGTDSPFPAVHRQPGSHVDMPGQHGNESPLPSVHRDMHASDQQDHVSHARRQSFLDPVSGAPVIISSQNNGSPRLHNNHLDAPNPAVHSQSLDATRGTRPLDLPMINSQPPVGAPPVGSPFGIPLMPMPIGIPFPIQRGFGRPFGGPLLPVPLGPPPLIVPPEVGRVGPNRGLMRRPLIMGRPPPRFPFLPPQSSRPRRIRLGNIIAGVIGSLLRL